MLAYAGAILVTTDCARSLKETLRLNSILINLILVISEADEGCSVVVMDRQRYIGEGYR